MKGRIVDYTQAKGIRTTEIWSGIEFEERLRRDTPSLIQQFCKGEVFPENAQDLKMFVDETIAISDAEILALLAQCFER